VSRGLDGCLYAYPRPDWAQAIEARLNELDPLSKETRQLRRYFYSGAIEGELDKQGRVGIPAALMEHAKLGRDVVVAGVHDHLEIWDRAAWRRELAEVEGSAEHVAERLAAQRD
jgi:MraZ protein